MSISFLKSIAYKSLVVGIVPLMVACGGGDDNNSNNNTSHTDSNNSGDNTSPAITPVIAITSPQENQNFLIGKNYKEEEITRPLTVTAKVEHGTGKEELNYKWSVINTDPADQESLIQLENNDQKDANYRISKNYNQDVNVTFKVTVSDTNNPKLSKDKEVTVHLKQPKIQLKVTDEGGAQNEDGNFNAPFSAQVIFPDYMKAAGYDQVRLALRDNNPANNHKRDYNTTTLDQNNPILNIDKKAPTDPLLYRAVRIYSISSSKADSEWNNAAVDNTVHNLSDAIDIKDIPVIGYDDNTSEDITPAIEITSPQEYQNFLIGKYYKEAEITHPLTAKAEVVYGTGKEELSYKWEIVSTHPADQESHIILENSDQKNARYKISKTYNQDVYVTFKVTVTDINNSKLSKDKEVTVHLKQPKIQIKVTDEGGSQNGVGGAIYPPFSVQVIFPDYMKAAGYDQALVEISPNGIAEADRTKNTLDKTNNYTLKITKHENYLYFFMYAISSSKTDSEWYNILTAVRGRPISDGVLIKLADYYNGKLFSMPSGSRPEYK